jgi:hypothetical protein
MLLNVCTIGLCEVKIRKSTEAYITMPSEMQHIRRLATTSQKLLHSVEVRGCFSSYFAATKMSKFGRQTEKNRRLQSTGHHLWLWCFLLLIPVIPVILLIRRHPFIDLIIVQTIN